MVAFLLFPSAMADRQFYQGGFMAPSYQNTYATASDVYAPYAPAAQEMMYAPEVQYAYPQAYPVYEQEAENSWSDVAMLAVAGAMLGAAISYKTQQPQQVSMLAVSGSESVMDKVRNTALAVLVSVGLMSTPLVAHADATVKLGSDSGQLVFVPDEVKIKAGESVTWVGNKGLPHNVVFDEDNVPAGTDLDSMNHEDNIGEEGEKVTTKFAKAGTYGYYCEPHRGAGMQGTVIVQ
jgi:plastocyanin